MTALRFAAMFFCTNTLAAGLPVTLDKRKKQSAHRFKRSCADRGCEGAACSLAAVARLLAMINTACHHQPVHEHWIGSIIYGLGAIGCATIAAREAWTHNWIEVVQFGCGSLGAAWIVADYAGYGVAPRGALLFFGIFMAVTFWRAHRERL
ncbi:hypothetical protein ACFZAU_14240 [Streptomyces sp. NPDC008238]